MFFANDTYFDQQILHYTFVRSIVLETVVMHFMTQCLCLISVALDSVA